MGSIQSSCRSRWLCHLVELEPRLILEEVRRTESIGTTTHIQGTVGVARIRVLAARRCCVAVGDAVFSRTAARGIARVHELSLSGFCSSQDAHLQTPVYWNLSMTPRNLLEYVLTLLQQAPFTQGVPGALCHISYLPIYTGSVR
jgi:hypothetical protein